MNRRRWTIVLSSMLVMQFLTAGASSSTHAAESIPQDRHTRMCGGSSRHFLNSAAYRNALEGYGLIVVGAPHESAIVFGDRHAWGAIWK